MMACPHPRGSLTPLAIRPAIIGLTLLAACGGDPAGSAIQVTVTGLDPAVTQLRTSAALDGVRVAGGERLCPPAAACDTDGPFSRYQPDGDRARFTLLPPARPQRLSLTVEALRGDRCFVAAGRGELSPDGRAVAVALQPLPAPRCCNAAWICQENPLPDGHGLNALWGDGAGALWAVGELGTIVRARDGAFARVPSPTTANLVGVWGRGPQDVWAVGRDGRDGLGVLLHDDGRGFAVQRALPGAVDVLWGWGDEFWVGGQGAVYRFSAAGVLLETLAVDAAVTAVGGPAPEQAWLAGSSGGAAVVLRRTGTTLTTVSPTTRMTPRALFGTATEAWVLGDNAGRLVLARRAGDGTWSQTEPLRTGSLEPIYRDEDRLALWSSAAGDLWVASGEVYHLPDRRSPPAVWTPEPVGAAPFARALFGDGVAVWAAGAGGRVLQGPSWSQRHPAPDTVLDTFLSISGNLLGPPWIGGLSGLYRGDRAAGPLGLAALDGQRGRRIAKVAAAGADVIAVRDLRDVLRVRPDGTETVLHSDPGVLYDLWVRGDDVWAVGDRFTHVRGAAPCGPPDAGVACGRYRGVFGRDSGELLVVGDARAGSGGCVLRCDESGRWTDETPRLTDVDLYDVWGGADDLFIVGRSGDDGLVLRRPLRGGAWQEERAAPGRLPLLVGVWAPPEPAGGVAWAVGNLGELWRRSAAAGWAEVPAPRQRSMSDFRYYAVDIFGLRADDVWLLGTHGTLLRYRP